MLVLGITLDCGEDGILGPIGNRPVVDFSKASAGRFPIGRRLPTCPTFAPKPRSSTGSSICELGCVRFVFWRLDGLLAALEPRSRMELGQLSGSLRCCW